MIDLDGTANRSRLGGNALIATSLAVLHAAAASEKLPLWQYLGVFLGINEPRYLPLPEIQIFGGGAHAARRVDVQDFMAVAVGAESYAQALDWTAEVYRAAGQIMADKGSIRGVADEGGYWPEFDGNEDAIETLVRAIEKAGLRPGVDVAVSLDVAASEFYRGPLPPEPRRARRRFRHAIRNARRLDGALSHRFHRRPPSHLELKFNS